MTNKEFIESIRLEGEEWRDVVGYEGRYIISSLGRVAALNISFTTHPYGREHIVARKPHLLRPTPFKQTRYLYIMFREGEIRHKYMLHRLVAKAFIDNPDSLPQVDHINGDRTDNRVTNLRWCTPQGNMSNTITQERVKKGRADVNFPYQIPVACLKDGILVATYESMYKARVDGFNPSTIQRCLIGKIKRHRGYEWIRLSDYETLVSMSKNSTEPNVG